MDKYKGTGRLKYIEPTNLNNEYDSGYSEDITYPYEDYCMSVDLTVRYANRYSCGWGGDNGDETVLKYSSSNGSLSFFGGTKIGDLEDGYLTTTYTDISMTNPGTNTSECLGIQSISISYDSWMHPVVVIKFIDVRGATVMQPSEQGYYHQNDIGMARGLYKSLFTFPYPMFELKVKGFYGKGVTYKLSVSKTDIEMDAENGNFIITVNFIGYMYGVFTDIPMTYIAAAPYTAEGKRYWEEKITDGTFKFKDIAGNAVCDMCKIPEFRERVAKAAEQLKSTSAASEKEKKINVNNEQVSLLRHIRDMYPLTESAGWKTSDDLLFYYTFFNNEEGAKEMHERIKTYYDLVQTYYDQKKQLNPKFYLKNLKNIKDITHIGKFSIHYVNRKQVPFSANQYVMSTGIYNLYTDYSYDNSKVEGFIDIPTDLYEKYVKLNKTVQNDINNYSQNNFYVCFIDKNVQSSYSTEEFFKAIDEQIKLLENQNNNTEDEYKKIEQTIFEKALGFKPSIKNIYNLIFAHMETFMHCFYAQTDVIRKQINDNNDYRRKDKQNVKDEDTDTERQGVNINGVENKKSAYLPPYTGFYKETTVQYGNNQNVNRKEMVWPEKICQNGSELEEVKFIKELLAGAKLLGDKNEEVDKTLNTEGSVNTNNNIQSTSVQSFIPLTSYDYAYKDKIGNPYSSVKNIMIQTPNDTESIEGNILGIFALRAFYYCATSNSVESNSETFGQLEALNIYKAFGDETCNGFLNFITKYADGENNSKETSSFIDLITTSTKNKINSVWDFGDDFRSLITEKNNLYYTLDRNENTLLPIGVFDFVKIKDDYVEHDKLLNNEAYIPIKITNIKDSGSYETYYVQVKDKSSFNKFQLFEDSNYIDGIFDNLKLEIQTSINKIQENTEYGNRDNDDYGELINKDYVLNNYKKKTNIIENEIFYKNALVKTNSEGKIKDVSSTELNKILKGDVSEIDNYFIVFPTRIKSSSFFENIGNWQNDEVISLFDCKSNEKNESLYSLQDNNLSRAYLFLQALPLIGETIEKTNNDGEYLKCKLLREGSYYWYIENIDKVNFDGTGFKKPEKDETLSTDSNGVMELILENDDSKYQKWIFPINTTPSRIEYLKNYFINWAESEEIVDCLRKLNSPVYYVDNDFKKGLNIKRILDEKNQSVDDNNLRKLQKCLRSIFFDVVTIFDYSLKYNLPKENKASVSKSNISNAFKNLMKQLSKIYGKLVDDVLKTNNDSVAKKIIYSQNANNPFMNTDILLSTYLSLKSLYDKWLCSPPYGPKATWSLGNYKESEFNNFVYMDSLYHDIGDVFPVNTTKVSEWLSSCLPTSNTNTTEGMTSYTGKTVYNFLTDVAQDNNAILLAIPQRFGEYDDNRITEMFKSYPLYSDWDSDESSFVFLYTYKPSEHLGDSSATNLDMNGYNPESDNVDLTDEKLMGLLVSDDGFSIPAFGVTYAKQNQAFFKNIRLNTADAGVTEAGIAATMNIASQGSSSPRETTLYGQDLYRILSQYSYKCSVEMMGNAQIMPLMYFQLNNIPLWKGGYQITKVSHEITAGNFNTSFEGYRINRYSIPMVENVAVVLNETEKNVNVKKTSNNNTTNDILSRRTNINGNKNYQIDGRDTIDFDETNVTSKKPIICVTPAHGPNTDKSLEWNWSSRVVDKLCDILRNNYYTDGTPYNVQRCNKNGYHTRKKYSMVETQNLINKYGSDKVISVTPHWNGGGLQRHITFLDYKGKDREDSRRLAECMKNAVNDSVNKFNIFNTDIGNINYSKCASGKIEIMNLPDENSDGAPRLNCACILTENWFADCMSNGKSGKEKWEQGKTGGLFYNWLISDYGVEQIAQMHALAIKKYIDSL